MRHTTSIRHVIRWYLSPPGLVLLSLLAVGIGLALGGYPAAAAIVAIVVLAVGLPAGLVLQRNSLSAEISALSVRQDAAAMSISRRATKRELRQPVQAFRNQIRVNRTRVDKLHARTDLLDQAQRQGFQSHQAAMTSALSKAAADSDARLERLSVANDRTLATLQSQLDQQIAATAVLADELADAINAQVCDGSAAGFMLAPGYRRRYQLSHDFDDTENEDEYQREVYDYALGVASQSNAKRIADFGCGSGFKLMQRFTDFETVGIDRSPVVDVLRARYPDRDWHVSNEMLPEIFDDYDMVIASDVIEHLEDPARLLDAMARSNARDFIISTPAREILSEQGHRPLGPPRNPTHYCEWSSKEFSEFVGSYLSIVQHRISNQGQATQLVHARRR